MIKSLLKEEGLNHSLKDNEGYEGNSIGLASPLKRLSLVQGVENRPLQPISGPWKSYR